MLANPSSNEPFDDIGIDPEHLRLQRHRREGFDPAHFDDLFQVMRVGEGISLLAKYPVLAMVVAEKAEDAATDFMIGLLITYREIFRGGDEDTAVEWIGGDAFQNA